MLSVLVEPDSVRYRVPGEQGAWHAAEPSDSNSIHMLSYLLTVRFVTACEGSRRPRTRPNLRTVSQSVLYDTLSPLAVRTAHEGSRRPRTQPNLRTVSQSDAAVSSPLAVRTAYEGSRRPRTQPNLRTVIALFSFLFDPSASCRVQGEQEALHAAEPSDGQ